MGFRSTITTEDIRYEIPQWFIEKYPYLSFGVGVGDNGEFPSFPISSKREVKFYSLISEEELFIDIQKILIKQDILDIVVVLLHECCGITRVKITQNSINAREPVEWREVEYVEHNYCYGCSDAPVLKNIK